MLTNFQRSICSLLSVAGAITLVVAASPAVAQDSDFGTVRTKRVVYADLNLDQAAGRATLERRLAAAASQVCATNIWQRNAVDPTCRERAMNQARRNVPAVTVAARD